MSREGWTPKVKQQKVAVGLTLTHDVTLDPDSPCDTRVGGI